MAVKSLKDKGIQPLLSFTFAFPWPLLCGSAIHLSVYVQGHKGWSGCVVELLFWTLFQLPISPTQTVVLFPPVQWKSLTHASPGKNLRTSSFSISFPRPSLSTQFCYFFPEKLLLPCSTRSPCWLWSSPLPQQPSPPFLPKACVMLGWGEYYCSALPTHPCQPCTPGPFLPLSSPFCSPPICHVAQLHLSPALLPFQSLSLLVSSRCHFTSPSISFMPLSSLHCNLNNCLLLFSHLLRWVEWVDGNETAGCQLSVP